MGIRSKLILSTTIPLLIIYVLVLGWDYWTSRRQALQMIEQLVAQRASADASQLNARLAAIQSIADRAAYSLASRVAGEGGRAIAAPATRPFEPFGGPPEGVPGGPPPEGDGPGGPGGLSGLGGPPPNRVPGEPFGGQGPGGQGPDGGRGGRPNRGPGERSFGRGIFEGLNQSPWVSAIWFRYDAAVTRSPGTPETFGLRRFTADARPFSAFTPGGRASAWFARPIREGRATWLDPDEVGDAALGDVCVFTTPFYANQDSTPAGVVCLAVPTAALRFIREDTPVQSQLRQELGHTTAATRSAAGDGPEPPSLAHGGYLLIDRKGRILARPDGQLEGTALAVGPDDDELRAAIDRSLKGSAAIVVAGGLNRTLGEMAANARYVLAMEQLSTTGWLYATAQSEADLLGPVQDRLINRAIFLAVSLLFLVGIVTLVLTRFCRPIEQMAATVRQLARGQLDIAPVPVLANDELGQLAGGFNDMTGRLRHHVRELTEQSAEREKVQSELRIARQIQRDLLPRDFPPFPHRTEFDLHAVNIPARHIAGDFFDFFFTADDRLIVVIADVSGKGVPAALMMAVTRTMVRNLAESGLSPCEIVERVNKMLVEDTTPGLFVTMVLGEYEPSSGRLTYVNAGHPLAVCYGPGSPTGTCCPPTGPLLGVAVGAELGPFEQATITLDRGHGVLFYTDGVTEAHDQTNVMFGEGRLVDRVDALAGESTPQLCEDVVRTVMGYQHQSAADDLTLVALRRN